MHRFLWLVLISLQFSEPNRSLEQRFIYLVSFTQMHLKHFLQKCLLKPDNWILGCDYVLTTICEVILFDISVLQVLKSTFSCSFGSIGWIWAFRVRFSWGKFAFAAMCTHEYARLWVTLGCWLLSCLGCKMCGDWAARAYCISFYFTGTSHTFQTLSSHGFKFLMYFDLLRFCEFCLWNLQSNGYCYLILFYAVHAPCAT